MVFEPISGTIGAAALLDPALRGFSWIYGKYKLGKQFGEHYQAFSIKYSAEVARFTLIRDQKISLLESSPLNDSERYLKTSLRDYLLLELGTFEQCEELMRKHDSSNSELDNDGKDDENDDEAQTGEQNIISRAISATGDPLPLLGPNSDSLKASTTAGQSTLRTSATSQGITPVTTPGSGSVRSDRIFSFRKVFHRKKRAGQKQDSIAPTSSAQQVLDASESLQDSRESFAQSRGERQKTSTIAERTKWVLGERERLKDLIKELTTCNNYFASVIQLQKAPFRKEPHSYRAATPSTQTKKVASHLRRLIRSLAATEDSNRVLFQMRLLDDPFDLRSRVGGDLPANALLRPSSSMYAFQILKSHSVVPPSQSSQRNENIPVIFEVPSPGQTSLDLDQEIEAERPRLESFAGQFLPADDPDNDAEDLESRPWWSALGKIADATRSRTQGNIADSIVVFHDRTPYVQSQTLLESFVDPFESKILGKTYLMYRIRLAYVLASTFTHFVQAGYPLDYFAKSLSYYSETTTQEEPREIGVLAQERISPYIQLRSIGASSSSKSSSLLFSSGAAETASKHQIMVQGLGVLLCEVGRWKSVESADDWRSRSSAARIKKVELMTCGPVGLFNVVHACLEFIPGAPSTLDSQVAWLEENAVQPLRRLMGNLPPEFQLT